MNQVSRSTGLKIAAVILWAVALFGMLMVGIPIVANGMPANINGPLIMLAGFSFAVDFITIVIAIGVWRAERWGIIMAIIISAFNALLNTGGVLFDPDMATRIMAGVFLFASLSVIYLCLRREPKLLSTTS